MRIFDLHCDTPTVIHRKKTDLSDSSLHINAEKIKCFEKLYQLTAIFIPDEKHLGLDYFKAVYDYFMPIAKKTENFEAILSSEGGRCIEGDVANLDILAEMGLCVFGLVWNGENELAAGGAKDNGKGLSEIGREAVLRCEALGITVDCSHLSDAGFADLAKISRKPFIATHSNARSIYNHLRNLTDYQLQTIFERQGLVGLNIFPQIISENPKIEDFIYHVDKMLSLGGENCIAMGGDLDGIGSFPKNFEGLSSYAYISEMFAKAFSAEIAEKIMLKNCLRFFGVD